MLYQSYFPGYALVDVMIASHKVGLKFVKHNCVWLLKSPASQVGSTGCTYLAERSLFEHLLSLPSLSNVFKMPNAKENEVGKRNFLNS